MQQKCGLPRKLKQLCGETSRGVQSIIEVDLPKVVKKGYPQEMIAFVEGKAKEVSDNVATARAKYAELAICPDEEDTAEIQQAQDVNTLIDFIILKVDSGMKYFLTHHAADMNKLAS